MSIADLSDFAPGDPLTADVVIVGGGPAGYAVAAGLQASSLKVLILESGLNDWSEAHDALNTVESIGEPAGAARVAHRTEFHRSGMGRWAAEQQGFGVRRRGLGGLSEVWSGKSAAFEDLDFEARPWVAYSGWPFPKSHLQPFIDRAEKMLNLGPSHQEEKLWEEMAASAPEALASPQALRSFFWQFARARDDRLEFMRFRKAFSTLDSRNVRIVLNATVTCLHPSRTGACVAEARATTLGGASHPVQARAFVLATGAIETPRLLLASARRTGHPLGNAHGLVGRFLMDHPSARIGRFDLGDCAAISRRFGFYDIEHRGQTHIYQHGLVLSPETQQREGLLNCAAYMMEQRAPDDPWEAIKRLLRRRSAHLASDAMTVLRGSGLVLRGLSSRLASGHGDMRTFRDRGIPHKLTGISIDAITEQRPDPDSRITLSERLDALNVPLPRVDWRIDEQATRSLIRIGQLMDREFAQAGLPRPILEDWVVNERPEDGQIIDMAHSAGTTRMAERPELGVVDPDARVFGLDNLYVAGSAAFPTVGHANPTLMIMTLAVRLADHLKDRLRETLPGQGAARAPAFDVQDWPVAR